MDQNLYNSENAACFTSAYEAGLEETQRAPFKMPVSISRRRLRRRGTPIPRIGFFEGIDRREATGLVRAQVYREEYVGIPQSPEDAIIAMIDGDIVETEEEANNVRTYFVDGLTDQERELVLKFGEEDPEPLHAMKQVYQQPESLKRIKRYFYQRCGASTFWNPQQVEKAAREEREDQLRVFKPKTAYVPLKAKLEPVDHEERQETRTLSHEFKQRSIEQLFADDYGFRNRYSYNQDRRFVNDCEHRSTIRTENWAQQFVSSKWDLHDYLMEQWNEAELAYQDFIREEEERRGAEAEAEFLAWEQEIEQAQRAQASEYETETAEERRGEIEWQNERRRDFVRQYRYTSPRIDDAMRKALRDYDMECTIYHDMQNPIWDMYADLDYSPEQKMDLFLGAI